MIGTNKKYRHFSLHKEHRISVPADQFKSSANPASLNLSILLVIFNPSIRILPLHLIYRRSLFIFNVTMVKIVFYSTPIVKTYLSVKKISYAQLSTRQDNTKTSCEVVMKLLVEITLMHRG